jgi:hypothetical protein
VSLSHVRTLPGAHAYEGSSQSPAVQVPVLVSQVYLTVPRPQSPHETFGGEPLHDVLPHEPHSQLLPHVCTPPLLQRWVVPGWQPSSVHAEKSDQVPELSSHDR